MKQDEMPIGFSMALAMNPKAMQKFSMLTEEEKKKTIEETQSITTKAEMQQYVTNLGLK